MKTLFTISIALLLLLFGLAGHGAAFQCGSKIIKLNSSQDEVLQSCGEPSYVNEWMEERLMLGSGRFELPPADKPNMAAPLKTIIYVRVQEWTYDTGPHHFQRILRFENGRLVDIKTGDYGN